jgi:hypothetical protein
MPSTVKQVRAKNSIDLVLERARRAGAARCVSREGQSNRTRRRNNRNEGRRTGRLSILERRYSRLVCGAESTSSCPPVRVNPTSWPRYVTSDPWCRDSLP